MSMVAPLWTSCCWISVTAAPLSQIPIEYAFWKVYVGQIGVYAGCAPVVGGASVVVTVAADVDGAVVAVVVVAGGDSGCIRAPGLGWTRDTARITPATRATAAAAIASTWCSRCGGR